MKPIESITEPRHDKQRYLENVKDPIKCKSHSIEAAKPSVALSSNIPLRNQNLRYPGSDICDSIEQKEKGFKQNVVASSEIPELMIDPLLADLLNPHTQGELERLRSSIKAFGCLSSIITWNGVIIDGIATYQICQELGIKPESKEIQFANMFEAAKWRIEHHLNRRQMNTFCRIEASLRLYESEFAELARKNRIIGARKGGKGGKQPAENLDSEIGSDGNPDPLWVTTQVAILADTNPEYVRLVRKLKNSPQSKSRDKLIFELRRDVRTISSLRSLGKKSNIRLKPLRRNYEFITNQSDESAEKVSKKKSESLSPRHKKGDYGWTDWQYHSSYVELKGKYHSHDLCPPSPQSVYKIADFYKKELDVVDLTAFIQKNIEMAFRIGVIRGKFFPKDLDPDKYFEKRSDSIINKFSCWIRNMAQKGNKDVDDAD